MTPERFNALVTSLERQAQADPVGYQRKVIALAMLGNAYVTAILLLLLLLLLLLIALVAVLKALAIKLILLLGVFLWMILKALWVKVEPPAGLPLAEHQAPELFAMIRELRKALNAPRFHQVLVTDEFNAGVVQSPRLGIFGWPRNHLLIGLPLMKSLTVEQFKAVLAHEFGHLARGHGRLSNWVYRQRLRWARLMSELDAGESRGRFLFKPFLHWFVPYFNAYSFPLARANEYQADATSARLTSPRAAAEALTGADIVGRYLAEHYWPGILGQADDQPQPNFAPYHGLGRDMTADLDPAMARQWLEQALTRATDTADTHPALADRLAAIGARPTLALPTPGQSAEHLLNGALKTLTETFDERWRQAVQPGWEARHREMRAGREQLAALEAKVALGAELSLQEAYERACLTESAGGDPDSALAQLQALHRHAPDVPALCLSLGARLLARADASGVDLVVRAMELDEDNIVHGCALLRDHYAYTGDMAKADDWQRRMQARQEEQEAAERERKQIKVNDKFDRHDLDDPSLASLRQALRAIPGLSKAYLVKKRVRHLAHRPLYVLGFSATPWYRLRNKRRSQAVMEQIQTTVAFPYVTVIIRIEGENRSFGRKLAWMRGSRIV
jgi:Zn-dependent protease with chaperone function